jgi:hypothetical protein
VCEDVRRDGVVEPPLYELIAHHPSVIVGVRQGDKLPDIVLGSSTLAGAASEPSRGAKTRAHQRVGGGDQSLPEEHVIVGELEGGRIAEVGGEGGHRIWS